MRPPRIRPFGLLVAFLLTAPVALAVVLPGPEPVASRPKPFDPLSAHEQAEAFRIALASPVVDTLLGDRYATIGAAVRTIKVHPVTDMPRLADVWFYDYATDAVVWPVVDLDQGLVLSLEAAPPGYQPPLSTAELVRAGDLARGHDGVLARLGGGEVASDARLWGGPETLCPVHRCVTVGFFVDDVMRFEFFVVVDLSADRVLDVLENPWFQGEGFPPEGGAA